MGHFAGKDIVARLRDAEPCADGHPCKAKEAASGCCCAEAADEIERLREQVRHAEHNLTNIIRTG